jgi:hypothetical protein
MSAGMIRSHSTATPAVEAAILCLATACGPSGSTDPTAVARALVPGQGEQWRTQLSAVRHVAVGLAQAGRLDILRKGRAVDPAQEIRGVIRLRIRPAAQPDAAPPAR